MSVSPQMATVLFCRFLRFVLLPRQLELNMLTFSAFFMPFTGMTCHIETEDTQFCIPSPQITQLGRRSRVTIVRKLVYLTRFIVWYSVLEFLTAMLLKVHVMQDVPLCDWASDLRRFVGL
jgi:hypothetical protein